MGLRIAATVGGAAIGLVAASEVLRAKDADLARKLAAHIRSTNSADVVKTGFHGRELLKAGRVVSALAPLIRACGYGHRSMRTVMPFLLLLESLVYSGDLASESWQQAEGVGAVRNDWHDDLVELLGAHGVATPDTMTTLSDLKRYFDLESALMTSSRPPTEEELAVVNHLRSSDIVLLIEVAFLLRGSDIDQAYLRLLRPWLLIFEIWDDFESYADDVASGSFNTVAVYEWMYGADAKAQVRHLFDKLIRTAKLELSRSPKLSIARFWEGFLQLQGNGSAGYPWLGPAVLRHLPRAIHNGALALLVNPDSCVRRMPTELLGGYPRAQRS